MYYDIGKGSEGYSIHVESNVHAELYHIELAPKQGGGKELVILLVGNPVQMIGKNGHQITDLIKGNEYINAYKFNINKEKPIYACIKQRDSGIILREFQDLRPDFSNHEDKIYFPNAIFPYMVRKYYPHLTRHLDELERNAVIIDRAFKRIPVPNGYNFEALASNRDARTSIFHIQNYVTTQACQRMTEIMLKERG